MKRTGAVIVTYNSAEEIGACLDAALARDLEVVVVDNASQDGTRAEVEKRPRARWIGNTANRGFAAAANQGIRALNAPFALLLNPDSLLLTGLEPLLAALEQPGVAAAGGKLVDEQGHPQKGFQVRRFPTALSLSFEILGLNRLWPANPVNRRYRCLDLDPEKRAGVEQPAGAFLMIRREAWEALGGFDEGFHPLWFEDVDFLKRLQDKGYRVVYEPAAAARHKGGHSVRKIPRGRRQVYWYASLLRYASKHLRPGQGRVVCAVLLVGSALRMVAEALAERSLSPLRLHGRVMRLASRRLISGRAGDAGGSPVLAQR